MHDNQPVACIVGVVLHSTFSSLEGRYDIAPIVDELKSEDLRDGLRPSFDEPQAAHRVREHFHRLGVFVLPGRVLPALSEAYLDIGASGRDHLEDGGDRGAPERGHYASEEHAVLVELLVELPQVAGKAAVKFIHQTYPLALVPDWCLVNRFRCWDAGIQLCDIVF